MPMKVGDHVPKLRPKEKSNSVQAAVTLRDAVTHESHDYYCGVWGTPAAQRKYTQLIDRWRELGYRLPDEDEAQPLINCCGHPSIAALCSAFWGAHGKVFSRSHLYALKTCVRALVHLYGDYSVVEFRPRDFKELRKQMMQGSPGDPDAEPPAPGYGPLSRETANKYGWYIISIFRWGVEEDLVPVTVHQALLAVKPIALGAPGTYETEEVRPADDKIVLAVLKNLSPMLQAMVQLQRHTGMRPQNLCGMTMRQLDMSNEEVWVYRPFKHKTQRFNHRLAIQIGANGQKFLKPYLRTDLDEYLFQPCEEFERQVAKRRAARTTPQSCGNTHRTDRTAGGKRRQRYTTDTYARAIRRACEKTFPPPGDLALVKAETHEEWMKRLAEEQKSEVRRLHGQRKALPKELARRKTETVQQRLVRLTPEQKLKLKKWARENWFHPHQIRHTFGTQARAVLGLEAAQTALGHKTLTATQIYAEQNLELAREVARRIG